MKKSHIEVIYRNSFYNPEKRDSKPFLSTNVNPVEYNGFLIYERIKGSCFDIVKDGICCGMFAGLEGAKARIDNKPFWENAKHKVGDMGVVEVACANDVYEYWPCTVLKINGADDRPYRVTVILLDGRDIENCAPECVFISK